MISGARQYSQRDFALSLTKARVALVTNAFRQGSSLSFPDRRLRPISVPSVLSALFRRYSTSARGLCKLIFSALSTNRSSSALSLLVIVP